MHLMQRQPLKIMVCVGRALKLILMKGKAHAKWICRQSRISTIGH